MDSVKTNLFSEFSSRKLKDLSNKAKEIKQQLDVSSQCSLGIAYLLKNYKDSDLNLKVKTLIELDKQNKLPIDFKMFRKFMNNSLNVNEFSN